MSIVMYTDGGARGNPGPAAAGVVIQKDGETIATIGQFLGKTLTNNWAEYQALILGLEKLTALGLTDETVEVRMDSELIVKQMKGQYRVKHADLKMLYQQVQELLDGLATVRFLHIPRAQNKEADKLVNEALDAQ